MKQVVIENPILNSPFEEPRRHFKFTEDGITDEIVETRRISQYFIPIPRPKKKSPKQLVLRNPVDRRPDRREQADQPRSGSVFEMASRAAICGITKTTARLLEYWQRPDREHKLFFCQIEALETAIWIAEVAGEVRRSLDRKPLAARPTPDANPLLYRIASKWPPVPARRW